MVFLIFLILWVSSSRALDVSWIPSDPDGPLPQSTAYRTALRQLCSRIASGSRLPDEINAKIDTLNKLCVKLKSSDSSYGLSEFESLSSLRLPTLSTKTKIVIGVIVVALTSYFILKDRGLKLGSNDVEGKFTSGLSKEEIREARLRNLLATSPGSHLR
jgi:hypothetical protein